MENVVTGAIALVKVEGLVVGKIRNFRYSEDIRREEVRGLGTIIASEIPVVSWSGRLSCDFFETTFKEGGITNAINRRANAILSQAISGGYSFEDNLVLNEEGVQIDLFKKVKDVVDPQTKQIRPVLRPFAVLTSCFIEGDGFDLSDGAVGGRNQSFRCLYPIVYPL